MYAENHFYLTGNPEKQTHGRGTIAQHEYQNGVGIVRIPVLTTTPE